MERCPSWEVDDSHSPTYIMETGDEYWPYAPHGKVKDSIYMYIFFTRGITHIPSNYRFISGWYSGNVVDFREQKCQHDYYLSHTAARVLDDQASLSTFLLAVLTIILNVLFLNPACHFFYIFTLKKKLTIWKIMT